jgi:hypothetical protein
VGLTAAVVGEGDGVAVVEADFCRVPVQKAAAISKRKITIKAIPARKYKSWGDFAAEGAEELGEFSSI